MSEPTTTGGKRRAEQSPRDGAAGVSVTVRTMAASAIWLVAVVAALFLAVGALLVALDFNLGNPFVSFVTDTAARLDLGELKSFAPGTTPASQHEALTKAVLVNWGIAAVVYLVVGKVLDRVVRP